MLSNEQKEYIKSFYANGGEHIIKKCIRSVLTNPTEEDMEEYMGIANEAVCEAAQSYSCDCGTKFSTFVYTVCRRRFISNTRKLCAIKRNAGNIVSLDAPTPDTDIPIYDRVADNKSNENIEYTDFWDMLTPVERKITKLLLSGFTIQESLEKLGISERDKKKFINSLTSDDKYRALKGVMVFKRTTGIEPRKGKENKMKTRTTMERYKNVQFTVASLLKKLSTMNIRTDFPSQRLPVAWPLKVKSDLITSILYGDAIMPITLAEQECGGHLQTWVTDGGHRLSSIREYVNDGFKISSTAEMTDVEYSEIQKDDNGNPIFDEKNNVVYVSKVYSVKGKRFSQLPDVLKDKILDYEISAIKYMSCSDEDIERLLRLCNNAKPMTAAQRGITFAGTQVAKHIKGLSKHSFFKDKCGIRAADFNNGTIDRIVAETIMTINYPNNWNSKNELNHMFLSEHATNENFDELCILLDELYKIIPENWEYSKELNSKELFIILTNYSQFSSLSNNKKQYIDFLNKWFEEYRYNEYEMFAETGTKSKTKVLGRISIMYDALESWIDSENTHIENGNTYKSVDSSSDIDINNESAVLVDKDRYYKNMLCIQNHELMKDIEHPIDVCEQAMQKITGYSGDDDVIEWTLNTSPWNGLIWSIPECLDFLLRIGISDLNECVMPDAICAAYISLKKNITDYDAVRKSIEKFILQKGVLVYEE